MNGFDSPTVLWLFVAAQMFGVASAWIARLSEGSSLPSHLPVHVLRRSTSDGGSHHDGHGRRARLLDGVFQPPLPSWF